MDVSSLWLWYRIYLCYALYLILQQADVVLNAVHRLKTNDNGNQQRIDDILTENMLFHAKDIVHIEARDINLKKFKKRKNIAIITNVPKLVHVILILP